MTTRFHKLLAVGLRFGVPGLLLLMAVATGLGAYRLFPFDTPVYSPPPLNLMIFTLQGVSVRYVEFDLFGASYPETREYLIVVEVDSFAATPTAPIDPQSTVTLMVPERVTAVDCTNPKCTLHVAGGPTSIPETFVNLRIGTRSTSQQAGVTYWNGSAQVRIRANRFAFAQNATDLEGQLPAITDLFSGRQLPDSTRILISYEIPKSLSFDWVGGPIPTFVSDRSVIWTETSAAAAQHVQISAVNRSAQIDNSNRTFFAGLLFGVAGGALVGALQESLHVHPVRPEPDARGEANRRTERARSRSPGQEQGSIVVEATDVVQPMPADQEQ